MNLRKTKYGTWSVRFSPSESPPNGKYVALGTNDRKEAESLFRVIKKQWHEKQLFELDKGKRILLDDFIKEYIDSRQDLSPGTLRMDRLALKALGDVVGHRIALRTINIQKINNFKKSSLGRIKPVSVNTYLRHIKAALNTAGEWGYLKNVPKLKLVKVVKKLPRVLTTDEIDKILDYSEKTDWEMWRIIQFALWTGCRRSEILGLTWQSVSDKHLTVLGKGGKERQIFLLSNAREAMGKKQDIGYVFARLHKDTVSHRFRKIAKECGIKSRFHDLRHTAATFMLQSGIPLEVIQKILGHSDIRTTQIYTQVLDKMMEEEMKKLRY